MSCSALAGSCRAALVRLTQDGLVVHVPNRGAQVRHIARAEAVEMLEARAVLEGLAVRYAARHATGLEIAELRALVERMKQWIDAGDLLAYSDVNAQLHAKLVSMANHRTVTLLLARLQANHVLYRYRMIMVPGRAAQSLLEHGAIVEAVAAHDEDAAEVAIRQHLTHSAEELRKSIESITRDGVAP